MAKGIDCNYEINADSINLDFKNGNFSRINFDELISVAYEKKSNFNFKDPFIVGAIFSGLFIICNEKIKHANFDFPFLVLIYAWSTLCFGLFCSVFFFFFLREKRDDIILYTRGGKRIVFSVDRGDGAEVVEHIKFAMVNR
jgi:hypothetical protein